MYFVGGGGSGGGRGKSVVREGGGGGGGSNNCFRRKRSYMSVCSLLFFTFLWRGEGWDKLRHTSVRFKNFRKKAWHNLCTAAYLKNMYNYGDFFTKNGMAKEWSWPNFQFFSDFFWRFLGEGNKLYHASRWPRMGGGGYKWHVSIWKHTFYDVILTLDNFWDKTKHTYKRKN